MKIITTFVVAFIFWYLLWAYSSFSVLVDFTSQTASNIFSETIVDVYTWSNESLTWFDMTLLIEQKKEELLNSFNTKIQETQEEMKQQIADYLKWKISSIFSTDTDN